MSMKKRENPFDDNNGDKAAFTGIGRKICLRLSALIVLLSLLIAIYSYHAYKKECIDSYASTVLSVARTVASVVDGDILAENLEKQESGPYRERILSFLNKISKSTRVSHIHVNGTERDGAFPFYAASGLDDPVGLPIKKELFHPDMIEAVNSGAAKRTDAYPADDLKYTSSGQILSGYSPIFDAKGHIVGVVGADIGVDRALKDANAFGVKLAAASLAMAGLIAFLIHRYTRKNLERPLGVLSAAAHKLAAGDVDIPRLPRSNDEIGVLSSDLSRVAAAVDSITLGLMQVSNKSPDSGRLPAPGDPLAGKFKQLADGIGKALTVMDNVDALVYVVEPETYRLVYYNRKMEQTHALSRTRPSDLICWKMFGETPDRPCRGCKLPEMLEIMDQFPTCEWEQYNTQLRAWFRIRNSIVRWVDGRIVLFCEAQDISQSKAVEEIQVRQEEELAAAAQAAQEASLMKTSFLANMSHEIRTPMNGIIGFAELAMDDPGMSTKNRGHLEKIKYSAEGLLQIINDILDISKIEAGKVELENVPFSIRDVFDKCEAAAGPKAREKGLQAYFYAEPFIKKTLMGDPGKLRQVLLNLLSNAIKFTSKGVVKLACTVERATPRDITLRFEVSDSGIGMTEEQIDKVFDAFTQVDGSSTRKYGGAGLGLSITKSFVNLMGGNLNVVSTPGIGSKFSFNLTFNTDSDTEVTVHSGAKKATAPLSETKPHFRGDVLVCEDNDINQEVIREHLERLGLTVTLAANGKEGVDEVRKRRDMHRPFDLILMDIHMPIMGGVEAAQQIRVEGCLTPIVALTANVMAEDTDNYLAMGMTECLGKPFRAVELWGCLRRHLKESAAPDAAPEEAAPPASPKTSAQAAVNLREGLENAAGNEELLQRLLRNFAADNQTKIEELNSLVVSGDLKTAHRLAHSLKSTARMIGAAALSDAAALAEDKLKEPANGNPLTAEDFARLGEEMDRVLSELQEMTAARGEEEAAPKERVAHADWAKRAEELLNRLEPLLESGDSDCLKMIDEVRDDLPEAGGMARELAAKIGEYDFEAAQGIVREIRNWLEVKHGLEAENE